MKFIVGFLALLLSLTLVPANPATAAVATPAPVAAASEERVPAEVQAKINSYPASAGVEANLVSARRNTRICGLRQHKYQIWQVSVGEGTTIARWRAGPGRVSYMLLVNDIFMYCDYRRNRRNKIINNAIQYCVVLRENWESQILRGVSFDGYIGNTRGRNRQLVSTYVDTDNLDRTNDVACSPFVGTSYIGTFKARTHPRLYTWGTFDLQYYNDKTIGINYGSQRGRKLSRKTGIKLFPTN